MARSDTCLSFVLAREGGYSNDPTDRGGATNMGITQRTYDRYNAERGIPLRNVRDITPIEVKAVYVAVYWSAVRGEWLVAPLDLVMFDSAVQHGNVRAIMFLQRSVGVKDDGVFGLLTLTAVNKGDAVDVTNKVMEQRAEFYSQIIRHDPTQQRFMRGWQNRLDALTAAANI